MSESEDDLEWQPPTEAEKKVLAARRERSDKISKMMGDYLLKGYRMLATTCDKCGTIELQDKQGRLYCVACSEVDCDENSKDNPVLSASAMSHQIAEEGERQSVAGARAMEPRVTEPQIVTRNVQPSVATRLADVTHRLATSSYSTSRTLANSATSPSHMALSQSDVVQESLEAVLHKMQEATRALAATENVDLSRSLVILIKDCADCILSLRQI